MKPSPVPNTPEAVAALARKLMADAGVGKLRKDHAQAIELLFSLAPDTAINLGDYFRRCVAWTGEKLGVSNVLSARHSSGRIGTSFATS